MNEWWLWPVLKVQAVPAPSHDCNLGTGQPAAFITGLQCPAITQLPFATFPAGFPNGEAVREGLSHWVNIPICTLLQPHCTHTATTIHASFDVPLSCYASYTHPLTIAHPPQHILHLTYTLADSPSYTHAPIPTLPCNLCQPGTCSFLPASPLTWLWEPQWQRATLLNVVNHGNWDSRDLWLHHLTVETLV